MAQVCSRKLYPSGTICLHGRGPCDLRRFGRPCPLLGRAPFCWDPNVYASGDGQGTTSSHTLSHEGLWCRRTRWRCRRSSSSPLPWGSWCSCLCSRGYTTTSYISTDWSTEILFGPDLRDRMQVCGKRWERSTDSATPAIMGRRWERSTDSANSGNHG
ncbi:hypothetical protein CYMTET_7504 [Cymbomonas tetramitiformis]|uniref:Uncharacterized protein n=1 Tax=Cymbomonas tetramitiformis TaxID=36881 RepID=A0AAE0LGT6_9CHLO|nr:hypothetical protein CYMTET_7504 [Cymbomonas tetramitiformis]